MFAPVRDVLAWN